MKFSLLSSLSLVLGAAVALPQDIASRNQSLQPKKQNDGSITIGPAPYDGLMAAVHSHKQALATENLSKQATYHGLLLCEDNDLRGKCYWGWYESSKTITPDPYWKKNISSLQPDQHSKCYVTSLFGEGNSMTSTWTYPGGNLQTHQKDNVEYFECKSK